MRSAAVDAGDLKAKRLWPGSIPTAGKPIPIYDKEGETIVGEFISGR